MLSRCRAGALLVLAWAAFPASAGHDLTTLSLEQLMGITVVGASKYEQRQSEVGASVSIITRDEIRAFGWRTLDQALASLPGIHTTYDRQYSYVGTRGFGLPGDSNTRLLVTINGNRTNEVVYDYGPTGRQFPLDLDLIERIEFIPGPGGAVYGQNAMFGVVNVITRTGAAVAGAELAAARQAPQALGEGRASFGKLLDNGVDVLISLSALHARGEDRFFNFGAAGVSGVAAGLDGERNQQFFASIARGPWAFELIGSDARKDDPTGGYRSDPLVAGQYQRDRYTLAQARYQSSFPGDALQLQARLFAGRYDYAGLLSYGSAFDFMATGQWQGGELRLLSTALANHKLMLGLEAQENTRVEQRTLDVANPANNLLFSAPGRRTGVYAQDEWRIAKTLTATLGLRVDRNNVTGTQATPRAALVWQATPRATLKALYGRAHRAPNAYERDYNDSFAQVANPALKGERIDTLELVADHSVNRHLNLRASAYQWRMRDLVILGIDPVSGLAQYQSGDRVKTKGLELSADETWDWGGRLRGSLSFQQARDASSAPLNNSPELLGKLNFSAPLPIAGLRLGYELQYDGQRRTIDGSDTDGYAVSNLHLGTHDLAKGLEVGLGIRNLFDKRYAHPAADTNWQNALEQDGRSVRLHATYKF
jgi:outer membrane receptor protein involved in Fe transport